MGMDFWIVFYDIIKNKQQIKNFLLSHGAQWL